MISLLTLGEVSALTPNIIFLECSYKNKGEKKNTLKQTPQAVHGRSQKREGLRSLYSFLDGSKLHFFFKLEARLRIIEVIKNHCAFSDER